MTRAVVRRWLKVADPTALTAGETLRRALGFGSQLSEVSRSEILAFHWPEPVNALEILTRLAEDTNLLWNPNKHFMEIAVDRALLSPRGNIWVLVARPGDGASLGETLSRHRLVGGPPPDTARGTLWELTLEGSPEERRRRAEAMAVVRGRSQGLLANPHVEDATVFDPAPSAEVLAGHLGLLPQAGAS